MHRILLYGLLLGGTLPLSLWLVSGIYANVILGRADRHSRPALALCELLMLLYAQKAWLAGIRNGLRARSLGCLPAPVYPHVDPVLGLDLFVRALRALRAGAFHDELCCRLRAAGGHTHWGLALGQWALLTDEPENVKALHATRFDDWPIAGPRLDAVLPLLGRTASSPPTGPSGAQPGT